MITFRPSDEVIGQNQYDLEWLVNNQVLTLEGELGLYRFVGSEYTLPLEVWSQIADETQETGNLTSTSNSKETQEDLITKRNAWLKNNQWVWGYPLDKINPPQISTDSKNTLPFKLTVNPRIQVGFVITLDPRRGYSGLLEAEYANNDYTRWGYDTFETFQGGTNFSINTLELSLVEGDSIEWDGSNFTVQHYGQIIFKDNYCTGENKIIPIFATSLGQTEEQASEQGRLDDPLTDEDEGIDLSGDDDPTTFRPVDFNKRRLEGIRKARYRNGSQTIGSAFLAGLAYMALTFIRRG